MNLTKLQKRLMDSDFEVVLTDGILQAAKETGDAVVEITVDSGGGAKVVKKRRLPGKNRSLKFKGKKIPIVCENVSTEMFRVQLDSLEDFDSLEKKIL